PRAEVFRMDQKLRRVNENSRCSRCKSAGESFAGSSRGDRLRLLSLHFASRPREGTFPSSTDDPQDRAAFWEQVKRTPRRFFQLRKNDALGTPIKVSTSIPR